MAVFSSFWSSHTQRYFSKMASRLNCLKVLRATLLMRILITQFGGILALYDGQNLKLKTEIEFYKSQIVRI